VAGQNVTFDFLTTGVDRTASGFRKVADNTVLAAKGAKILANAIETLGQKEGRTAAESAILAKALRETGVAEDRVTARAVLADAAIRRLDDAMKDAAKKREAELKVKVDDSELKKALGGLKGSPGLLGPAVALAPAAGVLAGVAGGAAAGLAGAFVAGGLALAAFGAVAKPVLTDAKTAATAVEKAQNTYNIAIAHGAKQSVAYKAEQIAIAKAYANLSPAQIALSKQIGAMASAWDAVKAAQTPVIAGALQPWLKSVTGLTAALGPIIAKVAPVIQGLGGQFNSLVNSSVFKQFRDFIGSTGAAAVSAGGSTIIDLVKSFMILLPKFDPLIREAIGWISRLGPAVLKWSESKKASDDITKFMQWFSQNGHVVGDLLKNIGGALKALAPGLTSGGALELKVISDFLGLVARLPPALAKPIAEVAGAALILSKLGVLKVGLAITGPVLKWLTGGLVNLGGGAAAGAEIRTAMVSGGAAAGAEIRAAMAGGGAAGAAGGAAGGLKGKLPPLLAPIGAALGPVLAGVISGAAIKALGDTLSPKGTFAGKLTAMFAGLSGPVSSSVLHAFTFGGLEGWLTAKIGIPAGKVMNDTMSGIAAGAKLWWGNIETTISASFNIAKEAIRITWDQIKILFLQGTGFILNIMGKLPGPLGAPFRAAHVSIQQSMAAIQRDVATATGNMQASIDRLHGKNVPISVTGSGHGGVVITTSGIAAAGQGNVRFVSGNAARGLYINRGTGPTADDVMIRASRGELIVPANMVQAGAVDHLRGAIPGFASGGFLGVENALGRVAGVAAGVEGRGAAAAMAAGVKAAIAREKAALKAQASAGPAGGGGGPTSASASQAQAYASGRLGAYGWGAAQMKPLIFLWNQESGWNRFAYNASSGATGIPQALPYTKMPRAAWLPSQGGQASAGAQIDWGLNYIKGRYGSPAGAWAHEVANNWYAKGGLVPGYASGGVAGPGAAYLRAWQTRHGGGYGAAWGPVVVNQQIAAMTAAQHAAQVLSGAGGLTARQHAHYKALAAGDARRLAVLNRELAVERAWRGQLGTSDTQLSGFIAAAGRTPALARNVTGWKTQIGRQKNTIAAISAMLGYSDAQRAAIAKAHPPPAPTGVQAAHSYGGDVANNLGTVLAAALSPFTGAARGGMVMDSGGWLRPGFNPVWNKTGRPEQLVPARSGSGKLQIEWVGGNGGDDLERWIRKNVRIRGGTGPGAVERAYGSR